MEYRMISLSFIVYSPLYYIHHA